MAMIPDDAFEIYVAMGRQRSYRALASRFGVSKRAITKHAAVHGWPERLENIEAEARERSDEKLAETLEEMRTRHLKTLRAMSARALAALKDHPLNTGMEAIKAAEVAIKLERVIAGEVSSRTEVSVEEVSRREIENLVRVDDDDDDDDSEG